MQTRSLRRELTVDPPYPYSNGIVRDSSTFPWHDHGFRPPAFTDLVIYQFHAGTFNVPDTSTAALQPPL